MLLVIYTCLDTTRKSATSYPRHTVGDRDGGQGFAIRESSISYCFHTIAKSDGFQGWATRENAFFQNLNAVADNDRGQTVAKIECIESYARHAIGNGNRD